MIRVVLPVPLRALAHIEHQHEIELDPQDLNGDPTTRALLEAIEARYPMLKGTIRDRVTGARRPFLRFFACARDLSHTSPDERLPPEVVEGTEPFLVVGAMAGG